MIDVNTDQAIKSNTDFQRTLERGPGEDQESSEKQKSCREMSRTFGGHYSVGKRDVPLEE